MKRHLLVIFSFLFWKTTGAQELALAELLQLFSLPTNAAVKKLQNGSWKIKYSHKEKGKTDYAFEHFNEVTKKNQYIQVRSKGQSKSLVYTVSDENWFGTLQSNAINQGFRELFYKPFKMGIEHTFLKDSSIVMYFNTSKGGDTTKEKINYEIAIYEFKSWITGFMPQNIKKRWSEADRYTFILKCIGKKEPALVKDMISGCSCGGAALERKYNIKTVLALNREELIMTIKPCFK